VINYRVILFLFCALITGIFLTDLPGNFIPYSLIISIAISVFLLLVYKLFQTKETYEEKKLIEKTDENREWLIKNGLLIKVDFNKCNIISNTSNLEVPVKSYSFGNADSRSLDGLYDPARTLEIRQINECRIQFHYTINGEPLIFTSPVIEKDKTTLLFLLATQKHSTLYYDPERPANFYFDLRFLDY
jgi:hypothetical protein